MTLWIISRCLSLFGPCLGARAFSVLPGDRRHEDNAAAQRRAGNATASPRPARPRLMQIDRSRTRSRGLTLGGDSGRKPRGRGQAQRQLGPALETAQGQGLGWRSSARCPRPTASPPNRPPAGAGSRRGPCTAGLPRSVRRPQAPSGPGRRRGAGRTPPPVRYGNRCALSLTSVVAEPEYRLRDGGEVGAIGPTPVAQSEGARTAGAGGRASTIRKRHSRGSKRSLSPAT